MLTFEITYCEQDYVRAVRFMSRRQTLIIKSFLVLGVVVIAVMLHRADYTQRGWWVKPFLVAWLTLFMGLFRLVQIRNIGKNLKRAPAAQGKHVWSVSDEGISVVGPLSTGDMKWEAIVKVRESKSDFFFYTSKSFSLFLPKRVLTNEGQIAELRQLLRGKLGNRAKLV